MTTMAKKILISAVFLLLSFSLANGSHAASAVKPLDLPQIKGKPGRGLNSRTVPELTRMMELLLIGKAPRNVPIEKLVYFGNRSGGNTYGEHLCVLAVRHLMSTARKAVLRKHNSRGAGSCRINKNEFIWIGRNKLEKEDSKKIFRQKYLPLIREAAAKVKSFKGFQEVIEIVSVRIHPDWYFRELGGFSLCGTKKCRLRLGTGIPMLRVKDMKPLTVWKMTEARARQLMNGLFASEQDRYLQVEMVFDLGGVEKAKDGYRVVGRIKEMALYAHSDKSLSKPLHRFSTHEFRDDAAVASRAAGEQAQAREQAHLASLEKVNLAKSGYFLAAYAELSGRGLRLADDFVERIRYKGSPFDIERQKDKDRARWRETLIKEIARFDKNKSVWVSGVLSPGKYNIAGSHFPLQAKGIKRPHPALDIHPDVAVANREIAGAAGYGRSYVQDQVSRLFSGPSQTR